jgi:hypothetical protein
MATEPPTRTLLPGHEPSPARATHLREVINDLIHLILGPQSATNTTMPRLPTRPTVGPLPSQKLLRLRARLRAALRP